MSDRHLAQMNVGRARYPLDDPRIAEFMDNLDAINALADASPGFVWRLQSDSGNATDIKLSDDARFIVNMSVWTDCEALFDFVYKTAHRAIMVRRREWFEAPDDAYQVLWWIDAGTLPTPEEGLARLQLLRRLGPSRDAFTFKSIFAPGAEDAGPSDMAPNPIASAGGECVIAYSGITGGREE